MQAAVGLAQVERLPELAPRAARTGDGTTRGWTA